MKFNCSYNQLLDINDPKIIPNPRNPNFHSFDQIERLAKIINYQGQRSPIVISNRSGFIVKGHGRLQAIQKLGWEKIAVDFQDYENEAQEFSDLIADNAIAEWSQMESGKILDDVYDLKLDVDFDLEYLGIDNFKLPESIDPIDEDEEGEEVDFIAKPATIKITCHQDIKDEVLIYLKSKLLETSFEGVHIE